MKNFVISIIFYAIKLKQNFGRIEDLHCTDSRYDVYVKKTKKKWEKKTLLES